MIEIPIMTKYVVVLVPKPWPHGWKVARELTTMCQTFLKLAHSLCAT